MKKRLLAKYSFSKMAKIVSKMEVAVVEVAAEVIARMVISSFFPDKSKVSICIFSYLRKKIGSGIIFTIFRCVLASL